MRVDDLERDGRAVFSSARWAGSPCIRRAPLFVNHILEEETFVKISNKRAVHRFPSSTLPSPTATAKNRPVTRILGFVMNEVFVVLAARSVLRSIRTKFQPAYLSFP
jgi:hypothetical protein